VHLSDNTVQKELPGFITCNSPSGVLPGCPQANLLIKFQIAKFFQKLAAKILICVISGT
jgi:hypothetical protein